jgi:hypothetical protein
MNGLVNRKVYRVIKQNEWFVHLRVSTPRPLRARLEEAGEPQ